MTDIKPDYKASVEFLNKWLIDGPWILTALDPNRKGNDTRVFSEQTRTELRKWLKEQGTTLRRNIYFTANQTVHPWPDKKPSKVDIALMPWLYVDIDPSVPPEGENKAAHNEEERVRILAQLTDLPNGIPQPTVVVFSGGGYQAAWKISQLYSLDGTMDAAMEAERYNRRLEEVLGGDNTHNLDRLLRLPGTVNRPDARKRKKGRVEALARVEWFNSRVFDINLFEKAEPKGSGATRGRREGARVPSEVARFNSVDDIEELRGSQHEQARAVIAQGFDPDEPDKFPGSRSEWLFFACCEKVRAGCSDDTIYSVITDPSFGVSASVLDKGSGVEDYAVRQIERAREQGDLDAESFQSDKNGKPYKNLRNARLAVMKLGVALEFNEFADRAIISGLPEFGPHLNDAAVTRMRLEIEERFGIPFGKDWFADFISDAARRNRKHPVMEFLDQLEWDCKPRLDGWLSTYLGDEDTPYSRAVGTLTLVAAVRRVRSPGCKFDEMVVLEGPQGSLKSSALKVLAVREDWFSDDLPLNAKAQQFIEQTVGKWVVEAGELKGMRKGDVESLKSCLSRSLDRARMAYGRLPIERARQFVIIGTTNSERYLKDSTGNRRFWPIKVGEVMLDELRRDREQLWAEAARREADGASIRLDPALYHEACSAQEARRVADPFTETLGAVLDGAVGKIRSRDAWSIIGMPPDRRTQHDTERFGEALRELGWKRKELRFGGNPEGAYVMRDKLAQRMVLEVVFDERGEAIRVKPKGQSDDPTADSVLG